MKTAAIVVGVLVLTALALFFFYGPESTGKQSTAPPQVTPAAPALRHTDLPNMQLAITDGSRATAKNIQGKAVLVLFQPDCDHCQREAAQIREHLEAFQGYTLYFISDAPPAQLAQFAQEYRLINQPNIHFAQTSIESILQNFGPIDTPSVFIYSDKGMLKKSFIGETPIEQILQHI
jgi:cytochrome oxidase Cu insertion factor (SCO1/SenC/PrrC family)